MSETTKYVENYISFVGEMIESYKKIGNLVDDVSNEITPEAINTALGMYYNTTLGLIGEYQRYKIYYEAEKLEFQVWEDEKFEEAKRQVYAGYEEKKVKPALKEIETFMRKSNSFDWVSKTMKLKEAEAKMRFMLRMMDTLKSYDNILTTISYNTRAEMKALSLDDRANATPEGVSKSKIRIRPSRVKVNN
jgi:hypothetical protein